MCALVHDGEYMYMCVLKGGKASAIGNTPLVEYYSITLQYYSITLQYYSITLQYYSTTASGALLLLVLLG